MTNAPDITATEFDALPTPTLEQLERQTIAMLYAIWRARGINKRIVEVAKKEQHEPRDNCNRT